MKSKKTSLNFILAGLVILSIFSLISVQASAMIVSSVQATGISPGEKSDISIFVENTLDKTAREVSFSLNLAGTGFTPVGSSEDQIDSIKKDEEEVFNFKIKAGNEIKPGDYEIPYLITYNIDDVKNEKTGTIGITVRGDPELSFSISTDQPVIGEKGKISLKIVNKGFGDARFVSVKISPSGYTLLSDSEVYIGSVDSDDFETAVFDVIFNRQNPVFSAVIQYKDFDNKDIIKNINLPVTVYTKEKAIELGIINKNKSLLYFGVIVALIILWILYRKIKKSRRLKKSRQFAERGRESLR